MTANIGADPPTDDGRTAGESREPITRRKHQNSWSANLEAPHHADDRDLILAEAIDAIEATGSGYHVNLVTHAEHGHPDGYLWPHLESYARSQSTRALEWEYVDQCGCGGHVTKVHVG
ncbi:CGCGG family rSAM-modified RiPP protein [Halovivax gelatinilyticus]|uniref:CGCGG family putative rSAM-modified RiPP protein n=1 Tax=Halovivax gelatinilyticus TaxID=2961597 RepID=UPI0020CA7950|nr:CGCGG family rSAM-modified RiPP protein [Halovivax gelatinilyticus]